MSDVKVKSPLQLVLNHQLILGAAPCAWSWFHVATDGTVLDYGTTDDLDIMTERTEGLDRDSAIAYMIDTDRADKGAADRFASSISGLILDILLLSEARAGFVRVTSAICPDDNCHVCGTVLPVRSSFSPPLAVGEESFERWDCTFEEAELFMEGLLRETQEPNPVFDQEEMEKVAGLLYTPGGRDFLLIKIFNRNVVPITVLQLIVDTGQADNPAVLNAAACLALIRGSFANDMAIDLSSWVLSRDPDHIFAKFIHNVATDGERPLREVVGSIKQIDLRTAFDYQR